MNHHPREGGDSLSCRLYLVTPPSINLAVFPKQVEQAFAGGDVACLQLRLKEASDEEVLAAAKALRPICAAHGAAFILNDRPDLAVKCDADGVHLGQEDLATWSVEITRILLGEEKVIGVTCHTSSHLAMEAGEMGADYVAFGAFYPTTSKPMEKIERWGIPTPEILTNWSMYTELPCVAIGGITPENCAPLVEAGADFVAVINAVWNHPAGPKAAVEKFNKAIGNV